eukprot:COSAG02_NODE_9146_length_2312_cov_3.665699_2_plen_316_part_00
MWIPNSIVLCSQPLKQFEQLYTYAGAGSVSFNGLFRGPRGLRVTSQLTLLNAQTAPTTVWAMGRNDHGQLGLGECSSASDPSCTGSDRDALAQVVALSGSDVVQVEAGDWLYGPMVGSGFSAALTSSGQVYMWGLWSEGYSATAEFLSETPTLFDTAGRGTVQLACGEAFVLALQQDGTVFSWGWRDSPQRSVLGRDGTRSIAMLLPALGSDNALVAIRGSSECMVLKTDGRLFVWGWVLTQGGWSDVPAQLETVGSDNVHVAGGFEHILLLKTDGTVMSWGSNGYGQVGTGNTVDQVRHPFAKHKPRVAAQSPQ